MLGHLRGEAPGILWRRGLVTAAARTDGEWLQGQGFPLPGADQREGMGDGSGRAPCRAVLPPCPNEYWKVSANDRRRLAVVPAFLVISPTLRSPLHLSNV
jgi:hypothetical protein